VGSLKAGGASAIAAPPAGEQGTDEDALDRAAMESGSD